MIAAKLLCTGLGVGLLRPAPGTWGSFAAILLAYPLLLVGGPWLLAAAGIVVAVAAFWAIPRFGAQDDGARPTRELLDASTRRWRPVRSTAGVEVVDRPEIVVDEVVGQWLALLPVAFGAANNGVAYLALWPGWLAAFGLFRLLDIWKPGPVGALDRRPGALGVMGDDLAAGALAGLGVMVLAGIYHGLPR